MTVSRFKIDAFDIDLTNGLRLPLSSSCCEHKRGTNEAWVRTERTLVSFLDSRQATENVTPEIV